MTKQFKEDVERGLSSNPKFLSSRYFYDKIGDALFVEIMKMPEYYLTNSELEIFKNQKKGITDALNLSRDTYFELIELGPGDGLKTKELLHYLVKENFQFDYFPVDISQHALANLKATFEFELPEISVHPMQGDYFSFLETIQHSSHPKVVLFLGSNLGNLLDHEAHHFLNKLGASLHTNDKIFLGLDLLKSTEIVLPAYNDPKGITAAFNLNLLTRINKELGGNFKKEFFEHVPEYDHQEGIAKSYLRSVKAQTVTIDSLQKSYEFEEGERIHTEISRKYNNHILEKILMETNFEITTRLTDSKTYFADYILNKK